MAEREKSMFGGNKAHYGNFCCVPLCGNKSGRDNINGIARSYYRWPLSNPQRSALWLKAVPRADWTPKAWNTVCSDHFEGGKKTQKPGTVGYVPTLFNAVDQFKGKGKRPRTSTSSSAPLVPALEEKKNRTMQQKVGPPANSIQEHKLPKGRPTKGLKPADDPIDHQAATWKSDHDSPKIRNEEEVTNISEKDLLEEARSALNEKDIELNILKQEVENFKSRVLTIDSVSDSANNFQSWTGLANRALFDSFSTYLQRRGGNELKYWRGKDTVKFEHFVEKGYRKKPGKERSMSFDNQLFLTLVKLKTGFSNKQLAKFFGMSESHVSLTFTTLINFLHIELKLLFEMPELGEAADDGVPDIFKKYIDLKVVLDCTEIQTQKSSDIRARKEFYSNYKSRDTMKFMVGLARNQSVNFVSKGWGGRASDKKITLNAQELLDSLPPGSQVMSDKGFNLSTELKTMGVELIIPDFKGRNRSQFTRKELMHSETVAMARIHVERIIQVSPVQNKKRVVTITDPDNEKSVKIKLWNEQQDIITEKSDAKVKITCLAVSRYGQTTSLNATPFTRIQEVG